MSHRGKQKQVNADNTNSSLNTADMRDSVVENPAEQSCESLLEAYKLCVEEARENTKNRNDANNRFVTILTALVAGMIGASQFIGDYIVAAVILIVAISLIWILHIRTYKALNSAKFKVIGMIEEKLNFGIRPFDEEWKILKKRKTYWGVSGIETVLAIVFIIVSIVVGAICYCKNITP